MRLSLSVLAFLHRDIPRGQFPDIFRSGKFPGTSSPAKSPRPSDILQKSSSQVNCIPNILRENCPKIASGKSPDNFPKLPSKHHDPSAVCYLISRAAFTEINWWWRLWRQRRWLIDDELPEVPENNFKNRKLKLVLSLKIYQFIFLQTRHTASESKFS